MTTKDLAVDRASRAIFRHIEAVLGTHMASQLDACTIRELVSDSYDDGHRDAGHEAGARFMKADQKRHVEFIRALGRG